MKLAAFLAVASLMVVLSLSGCCTRYPADALNPPTNAFGPHAGTPDLPVRHTGMGHDAESARGR